MTVPRQRLAPRAGSRAAPVAATVVAVLGLAGCGSAAGHDTSTGPSGGNRLAALSTAIAATNASRTTLLADLHTEDSAAAGTDAADAAALTGSRSAAAPLEATASSRLAAAAGSAVRTPAAVTGYTGALSQLSAAAAGVPISAAQRQALDAVVTAGRTEAGTLRAAAAAYAAALPLYQRLGRVERTWLAHASTGWFATQALAVGAYEVARGDLAGPLAQARAAVQAANQGRQAATGAMEAALAAARVALASLSR